ncbi:MAG: TetR family transcriptional regulator [SAR86 cluster bacterium]|uniref:TetR family transcriptional regulator n=1 Tax=SAR86 cluster bacterium TaxID=2030880 RepID=A0A2A5AWK5_9GAMM|nr:MAG: TetR family transcriptional regulator [SAR86 cluster bacterium]
MRHKGISKDETRTKMIEAASKGFRRYGYGGIGIDGLSKSAGVTSGAFYSHFGSKNEAFAMALASGLDDVIASIPAMQQDHGTEWVTFFAEYYLGMSHRNDLEQGCAMATLTPEVVRFGPDMREMFEEKMSVIVKIVAQGLAGGTENSRSVRAWSMLGVLIGGISIARGMKSKAVSNAVADAIKSAAIDAAGRACSVKRP